MICQLTKRYILEQAKENNIELPSNYEATLEKILRISKKIWI